MFRNRPANAGVSNRLIAARAGGGVTAAVLVAVNALVAAFGGTSDKRAGDGAHGAADDRAFNIIIRNGSTDRGAAQATNGCTLLGGRAGGRGKEEWNYNYELLHGTLQDGVAPAQFATRQFVPGL